MLHDKGFTQTEIEKITEPGYKLLREGDIWRNMTEGLAIFMSNDYFKYIRLTITPKEEILINNSFYLRPLVPVIADLGHEHFYLLMISMTLDRVMHCRKVCPLPCSANTLGL